MPRPKLKSDDEVLEAATAVLKRCGPIDFTLSGVAKEAGLSRAPLIQRARHGLASVQPLHAGVFTAVQRFRSDLGLYVHLHTLVTDGAFEEAGADVRFLPARAPTQGRMTAVLAQVHKAVAAVAEDDDLDIDPALAACVQLALAGPHTAASAPSSTPAAAPRPDAGRRGPA